MKPQKSKTIPVKEKKHEVKSADPNQTNILDQINELEKKTKTKKNN